MGDRKRLILTRHWYDDDRTIGELSCDGEFVAFTLEPGRMDDRHQRVSTGFYALELHGWEIGTPLKYKRTWALVGRDVEHQDESDVPRHAILFHTGNRDDDTRGCILLGKSINRLYGETALRDSLEAMTSLRNLLGQAEAYLVIKGG